MADRALEGWAAGRAPDLLARAEAEAVRVLRDALVEAALAERRPARSETPAPPAARERPAPAPEVTGDALWAYGIVGAGAALPGELAGVHEAAGVELVEAGDLAMVVSRVPLAEFGAEPLRDNLNDLAWLERVARAHEAVLDRVLEHHTVVPLRLCTLYETAGSVSAMLVGEHEALTAALGQLDGRQEWSVKLLADPAALARAARGEDGDGAAEPEGGGGAYLRGRRAERETRERAGALATELAEEAHAEVAALAVAAVSRPPQNPELSGHTGEMLLNGAYLVAAERVEQLRALVGELERRHAPLGVSVELTGPWPPYNFVPGEAGAFA